MRSAKQLPSAGAWKGHAMQNRSEDTKITGLLDRADERVQQINSDAVQYMDDDHRLVYRKHIKKLERIKSEARISAKVQKQPDISDSAEGMHAAIQDIVKAMQELTHHLI